MIIPNYQTTVASLAAQYPEEFTAAHRGGAQTEAFIRRVAWVLHQQDPLVGLNGKRGNPNDLSDDALCYRGRHDPAPGGDYDPTDGNRPVTVIDVIAGAPSGPTGPNGTPAWIHPLTPAAAAWVQPRPVEGTVEPPKPAGPTKAEVQAMIDASIAEAMQQVPKFDTAIGLQLIDASIAEAMQQVPKFDTAIGLQANGGKVLCAEGGGPTSDGEAFNLTARSGVGPWESWTIRRA